MLSVGSNVSKQNEAYQELINTLCEACSYDLNTRGIKLLEEAASAISVAVDKLNELEEFIAVSKCNKVKKAKCIKENGEQLSYSSKAESIIKDPINEEIINKNFTVYFSVNQNVAENHIVEALEKAEVTNFVLDKLVNRINFAYGFVSFKDEQEYEKLTSSTKEMFVGSSNLKIIPKSEVTSDTEEGAKKSKKRKRKKLDYQNQL